MKTTFRDCENCGKKINLDTCDLEHDGTPICPHCVTSRWEDKSYQTGYDYACGYRD